MSAEREDRQLNPDDPWPGLDAFEESAHQFFHGRDAEANELARHVGDAPVTVLFGKSGLGKTSLLKAGVFPRLRIRQFLPVYVRFDIRPGAPTLLGQVSDTLRATLEREGIDAPAPGPDETLWRYLHRSGLELWDARNYPLTPVLVFDQFEEVFTLGASVPDAIRSFRLDLADLAENRIPATLASALDDGRVDPAGLKLRSMPYKLVISLREDFLPDLEVWRRAVPSLGRVRVRLLPMRYEQAMSAVYDAAPHLMDRSIANRIVRFVAAEQSANSDQPASAELMADPADAAWWVEPALLSLFCRGLNERRKQQASERFDGELLDKAQQGIISDYYRSCLEGLPDSASEFIENELITEKGFRNSFAKDDAVPARLSQQQLDALIRKRLLRIEERYGTQRIELTHDVLTRAVREHRDSRRAAQARAAADRAADEQQRIRAEAARQREAQLEAERRAEREKRLESEARAGRQFKVLAAALAAALVGAIAMTAVAIWQSRTATAESQRAGREAQEARAARDAAGQERSRAELLLKRITDGLRMKQAVLSGDRERIQAFLSSDLANHSIRFSARADDLGYSNPQGQRIYKFQLFPVNQSLPGPHSDIAVITYRMEHPTFQNALLATGPDRAFVASYTGWGCLRTVTALIEYVDPQHSPEIASFDMCAAIGW